MDLMYVAPKLLGHSRSERWQRRAQARLAKAKEHLAANGVEVNAQVRTGSPARVLIGSSHNYDLTVVAAVSHKGGTTAGLGPVASRVAEHATSAVLIARDGPREAGFRVLAAVDGSEASQRGLSALTEFMDLTESEVTLLHVAETPWIHDESDQEFGFEAETDEEADDEGRLQSLLLEEGRKVLLDARGMLPAHCAVTTLTKEGLPADEILGELDAGNYDLVVVGTTGSTDLKHRILGSVSAKIAWNAPCSVLLVAQQT